MVEQAAGLLQPPLERWNDSAVANRPGVRGGYGGRRATLRVYAIQRFPDGLSVELEGPTLGARCSVSPPAVFRSGPLTGDQEFDARFEIYSVPKALGLRLFDAPVRAQMKLHPSTSLNLEGDRVSLHGGSHPRPVDWVAAQLGIAAMVLDRLPDAVRSVAEAGQPSVATHPEVVEDARRRTRLRTTLLIVLALAFVAPVVGIVATVGAVLLSREPAAPPTAVLDLMRPGASASFQARAGQRITFRTHLELGREPLIKRNSRQTASAVVASTFDVALRSPGGTERTTTCRHRDSGVTRNTDWVGIESDCVFIADQSGSYAVRATAKWHDLTPRGANLAVIVSDVAP